MTHFGYFIVLLKISPIALDESCYGNFFDDRNIV